MKILITYFYLVTLIGTSFAVVPTDPHNLAISSIRYVPRFYNEVDLPVPGSKSRGTDILVGKVMSGPRHVLVASLVNISNKTQYTVSFARECTIDSRRYILQGVSTNALQSFSTNAASCTLRDIDSGALLTITNKWVQQSVPGYPPQSVGSPEP